MLPEILSQVETKLNRLERAADRFIDHLGRPEEHAAAAPDVALEHVIRFQQL